MPLSLALGSGLTHLGGRPYSALFDPRVLDVWSPNASAVLRSDKLGLTPTASGAVAYGATSYNGRPGIVCSGGHISIPIGAALAGKQKLWFVFALMDQSSSVSSAAIVGEYANVSGTGPGSIALLREDGGDLVTEMWGASGSQADYFATSTTSKKTLQAPTIVAIGGDFTAASGNPFVTRVNGMVYGGSRPFSQAWSATGAGNFTFSLGARASGALPYNGVIGKVYVADATAITDPTQLEAAIAAEVGLYNLPVPDGLRILLMGDSNTLGIGGATHVNCWRNLFTRWLLASSSWPHAVTLGTSQLNPDTDPSANPLCTFHQGISGYSLTSAIGDEASFFGGAASGIAYQPDVAIISLGTNDAPAADGATMLGRLQTLMDYALSKIPRIRFVVKTPIFQNPAIQPTGAANVVDLRNRILGGGLDGRGYTYTIADSQSAAGPGSGIGWNLTDFEDPAVDTVGKHENESGHGKDFPLVRDAFLAVMTKAT